MNYRVRLGVTYKAFTCVDPESYFSAKHQSESLERTVMRLKMLVN